MTNTLIKADLSQSPYDNGMIHNRWHPDIPMRTIVDPGDDFVINTYDWIGDFIKNDAGSSDARTRDHPLDSSVYRPRVTGRASELNERSASEPRPTLAHGPDADVFLIP